MTEDKVVDHGWIKFTVKRLDSGEFLAKLTDFPIQHADTNQAYALADCFRDYADTLYLASRPTKTTTARRCPRCRGARTTEADAEMPCRVCDGAGTVETYTHEQVQAMLIDRIGTELDAAIDGMIRLGVECDSLRDENARLREALGLAGARIRD